MATIATIVERISGVLDVRSATARGLARNGDRG